MKSNYRRCISCRKIAPKQSFWRVIRIYSSGQIELDRGMGRSAYICPQKNCLQKASHKNRLGRSLKAKIPEHIYRELQLRLAKSVKSELPKASHYY